MPTDSGRSLLFAGLVRVLADAELVALGIGEHGPDESGHLVLTYDLGPKPHEARHLGYTRTAAEIHVNSVLSHAWFRHSLQPEHGATVARPRQEHEIAVVTLDGNVERFQPERRQLSRLCAVDGHHPDSQTHELTVVPRQ
jgi:hypothetical protein